MKNPKFQPPTVKGIPDSAPRAASGDDLWGLRFGVSLVLGVWCLVFFSTASAFSQSYSLDWFTIDGGGGTSSGGSYTLNGTIGQPDAGTLSGGSYTLEGGFWPGIVVPATGAPTLFMQFSGNNVVISWSPATPGFTLEEKDSLSLPSWLPAPSGNPTPPIPAASSAKFYRLHKP